MARPLAGDEGPVAKVEFIEGLWFGEERGRVDRDQGLLDAADEALAGAASRGTCVWWVSKVRSGPGRGTAVCGGG